MTVKAYWTRITLVVISQFLLLDAVFVGTPSAVAETAFDATTVVKALPFVTTDHNTCGIKSGGRVKCWGDNSSGQNDVPSNLGAVTQVTGSSDDRSVTICAIDVDQLLTCWGSNEYGQAIVPGDLGRVLSVSAGGKHVCAINIFGLVRCWGRNGNGEASVPSDLGTVKQVSAAQWMTCAITTEDLLRCWGHGNYADTNVPRNLGKVNRVSPGSEHVCVLDWTYSLVCWGVWFTTTDAVAPSGLGAVPELSSGGWNTCVLTSAGQVKCFGSNHNGVNVPPANLPPLTRISAGWIHTCGSTNDGQLICWGNNTYGESQVPTDFGQLYSEESDSPVVRWPGTDSYYFINTHPLNWDQARAQAKNMKFQGMSGYLANITSKEENDFIVAQMHATRMPADDAWFGARADQNRNFRFADGEEAGQGTSFHNWNTGEPNNYDDHEFYAAVKLNSTWNDYCDCRGLWSVVEFRITLKKPSPQIFGIPEIGETLTADSGLSSPKPNLKFKWLRDGVPINGADYFQYKVVAADYLKRVSVQVVASQTGLLDQAATSSGVLVLNSSERLLDLKLSGKSQVGFRMSVKPTKLFSKYDYTYQWYRNKSPIQDAGQASYLIEPEDFGKQISAKVCSWISGEQIACNQEYSIKDIELGMFVNVKTSLSGTAKAGRILTALTSSQSPGTIISFQWQSNGVPISGANSKTYLVLQADRGKRISAVVTFNKPGYQSLTIESVQKNVP